MTFYFYVWLYPPRFLELYLLKEAKKEVKSLSITHKKKSLNGNWNPIYIYWEDNSLIMNVDRRLKLYFQTHTIEIMVKWSFQIILSRLNLLGCMIKWSIKLFDIWYVTPVSSKAQVLSYGRFCGRLFKWAGAKYYERFELEKMKYENYTYI